MGLENSIGKTGSTNFHHCAGINPAGIFHWVEFLVPFQELANIVYRKKYLQKTVLALNGRYISRKQKKGRNALWMD